MCLKSLWLRIDKLSDDFERPFRVQTIFLHPSQTITQLEDQRKRSRSILQRA